MSFLLIKVGRSQENDIVIDDARVDAQHLEIFVDVENNVYLTDLNTQNGTFVNDKRIKDAVQLFENDEVKVANAFRLNWKNLVEKGKRNSYSVGSGTENRIVLSDAYVDKKHLQIYRDFKGNVFITDLKSTNGTFINDRRVDDVALLQKEDRLRIGRNEYNWQALFETGSLRKIEARPTATQRTTVETTPPKNQSKVERKPESKVSSAPKEEKKNKETEVSTKGTASGKHSFTTKLVIFIVIDIILYFWFRAII